MYTDEKIGQFIPADKRLLAYVSRANDTLVRAAIAGTLKAKSGWEAVPWPHRATIFLRAANLISGKYRYDIMAATIRGQGKNIWQADVDIAEVFSLPLRACLCHSLFS